MRTNRALRVARVVAPLMTLLGAVGSYFSVQEALIDPDAFTATATVTYVHPGEEYRRVYDVTFVTQTGIECSSTVNTGFFSQKVTDQPNVGDRVLVRYQVGSQPCALVREASQKIPLISYVMPLIFLVVGA